MLPIYLDNNATTRLDPRVEKIIVESLALPPGNPSSLHRFGQEIRAILTKSRRKISEYLKVKPQEIVFTSGGSEGLNLLIRGIIGPHFRGHIITSDLEHAAVFNTVQQLEEWGCEASYLSGGLFGAVTLSQVKEALRPDTRLIVLMAVNNETGVKTDFYEIAQLAEEANIPFVLDGVSLLGKESFSIPKGVSAAAFSGHKIHAPTGIGFNFVRNSLNIQSVLTGGHQENMKRGGTENILGAIALGEAVSLLESELKGATAHMTSLRDHFEHEIISSLSQVFINGEGPRISNTSNLSFLGVDGESLLMNLDLNGLFASHGSACTSGALEPSRVLLNMGMDKERAKSSIRFSLSRMTIKEEINQAIDLVIHLVKRQRAL